MLDTAKLFTAKLPKDVIVIAFYEVFGSNGLTVAFCDSKDKLENHSKSKTRIVMPSFLFFTFLDGSTILVTYICRKKPVKHRITTYDDK